MKHQTKYRDAFLRSVELFVAETEHMIGRINAELEFLRDTPEEIRAESMQHYLSVMSRITSDINRAPIDRIQKEAHELYGAEYARKESEGA